MQSNKKVKKVFSQTVLKAKSFFINCFNCSNVLHYPSLLHAKYYMTKLNQKQSHYVKNPYLVRMGENTNHKHSEYGHFLHHIPISSKTPCEINMKEADFQLVLENWRQHDGLLLLKVNKQPLGGYLQKRCSSNHTVNPHQNIHAKEFYTNKYPTQPFLSILSGM